MTVGVAGLAIAAYSVLHFTYGPSSPEKLEDKLQAAVASRNVDQLLAHLDDSNKSMREEAVVEAFRKAFNDETADGYEYYLKDALYASQQEQDPDSYYPLDGSPIKFVEKNSWRGSKWVFDVTPSEASFEQGEDWKASGSLETLDSEQGVFDNLWPAVYSYEAKVSNAYGGEETVQGTVDLLNSPSAEVSLSDRLSYGGTLYVPAFQDVVFSLNGVELPAVEEGTYRTVSIVPVPAEANVEANGTYLGTTIKQAMAWDADDTGELELNTLLKQAVAEKAANLVYEANLAWTKAYNAGNVDLLAGLDPDGDAYYTFSGNLTDAPEQQVHLVRIAVAPSDIELFDDQIRVTASEEYSYPGSDVSNNVTSNTYVLTQQPGQDQWWISSASRNYYWGEDLFNDENSLIVNNPEN